MINQGSEETLDAVEGIDCALHLFSAAVSVTEG